jgi:tRNA1Val (adenine37-N6)-methyltransferase
MGRNSFFQFKQFRVVQEKAAMKVGIDGVLLGAWADLNGAARVLDVGTGTGLLALMAAQRGAVAVDAVEIEPEAASEAFFNFQHSKWPSQINLSVCSFQDFRAETKYSRIISNPPFFENGSRSSNSKKAQARHSDTLSLKELLGKAEGLLAESGKISLILPTDKEVHLDRLLRALNLHINRFCRVAPDETRKPHRILAELSKHPGTPDEHDLFIRDAASGNYSDQYRELTKDFYLAF